MPHHGAHKPRAHRETEQQRPWSLRERLDEREIAELITTYCDGDTAASLATTHGVSLSSVKHLLHRRCPPRAIHPRI